MQGYKENDVNGLLVGIRVGSDSSFSELVEKYQPMMRSVALHFVYSSLSIDELYAEAVVALHRAAMSYDVDQVDVSFGLYARICVYNKLLDLTLKQSSHDRVSEDVDVESIAAPESVQTRLERQETASVLRSCASEVLSEYEHKVFDLCLAGYKTAEIAKILSKTPKSVDNAKARMLKHMREGLERILEQ